MNKTTIHKIIIKFNYYQKINIQQSLLQLLGDGGGAFGLK